MSCLVCHKPLGGSHTCPRCGFTPAPGIGNPVMVRKMLEEDAAVHRSTYLSQFDFGITCYRWKDQNGTYAVDSTERMSFGTGEKLYDSIVWLDQEFARLPEEETLTIDVNVRKQGASERTVSCQIPALKEPQLQRLGLSLALREDGSGRELCLMLSLKNGKSESFSAFTPFLPD